MKKYLIALIISLSVFSTLNTLYAWWWVSKDDIIVGKQDKLFDLWPSDKADLTLWVDNSSVSIKDNFLKNAQKYILWIVALVAISMFFHIWYMLATAEWKQDQLTKWMKWLIYLIVWLAVIPLAYVVIKITTWFSF